jgi:Mg2+ and Co2+ transporter CorA
LANRAELLNFLNHRVFDPILKAKPDDYDEADRKKLQDVQDRTKSEKERFHHYRSAKEIMDNYKSDLHSSTAKRVNSELEKLKLPTLPSVKEDFLHIAEE